MAGYSGVVSMPEELVFRSMLVYGNFFFAVGQHLDWRQHQSIHKPSAGFGPMVFRLRVERGTSYMQRDIPYIIRKSSLFEYCLVFRFCFWSD